MRRTLEERVLYLVEMLTGTTNLTMDTALATLPLDSLDELELVMAIEQEFDMNILNEDTDRWTTPRDIVGYLRRHGH